LSAAFLAKNSAHDLSASTQARRRFGVGSCGQRPNRAKNHRNETIGLYEARMIPLSRAPTMPLKQNTYLLPDIFNKAQQQYVAIQDVK